VFFSDKYVYKIPEEYINKELQIALKKQKPSKISYLKFYIYKNALFLKGKYSYIPFKIKFYVYRKSKNVYYIRVSRVLIFYFIPYSRNAVINAIFSFFKNNYELSKYLKIEKNKKYVIIKTKTSLEKIFPAKFRSLRRGG
jgi:hypothetical protein